MSETSSEKGVKLPTFDGDYKKFQMWWTRFSAYATVYKFWQALTDEDDDVRPSSEDEELDLTTAEGKKQEAAKKRNEVAMASFTMAFTSEGVVGMVYKSYTTEWPNGLAKLVVASLLKKYRPIDTISRVEMRQRLSKVAMKKGSDPSTLFEQLSAIEKPVHSPR
jgi:hypothetical protein